MNPDSKLHGNPFLSAVDDARRAMAELSKMSCQTYEKFAPLEKEAKQ